MIEDAQRKVDFPLAVPADVPPELEFVGAYVFNEGASVDLVYRQAEGDHSVTISEFSGDVRMGHEALSPVEVQGTSGFLVRGEDIGNPGLVAVQWRKDGVSFVATAFPDDSFTEEEFLEFLNSLEPFDPQG